MNFQTVDSLDDPRLRLYRNVKDAELAREGDRFIVEGHFVVQRVLASDFPVESLMIARRKLQEMTPFLRPDVPVYVVPDELTSQIIGFGFHTGVIAVARRKTQQRLEDLMAQLPPRATLIVLPQTTSLQNMGSIVRISAAFGVDGVIIGPESVDPFYRLAIRVSMGNCFRLPIVRSDDLKRDLTTIRDRWGVELCATVLDESAEPLRGAGRTGRIGILFGSEGYGLDPTWVALCSRRLTIPMRQGTDSLNVAVAAAIFLYELT